jgi:creatinine amidohydrolase
MQWEKLTSLDFEQAVADCQGVGLIAVGVIEPHAAHLPLGMDAIAAHWVACRAAEQEPAIIYPFYPYGINIESAHLPGSVVLRRELVFALLENICDEMARHGLNKIILLSGHGGNRYFLPLFVQTLPEKDKPYVCYYADLPPYPSYDDLLEGDEFGHACEAETSAMLHIDPSLVKMEQIPPEPFTSLKRNQDLAEVGGYTQMDWYAQYPSMYVGDSHPATAAKGQTLLEHKAAALVRLIQAVKADQVTPELVDEFIRARKDPGSPESWQA